jgi:hypothetical protein
MTDREVEPLNKSGIESSRETESLQSGFEGRACSQAHHVRDPNQLAPLVAFLHLALDQARFHLPPASMPSSATSLEPVSKMGGQRIKVQV